MVLEMSLLAFVPLHNISFVFWAFFINRILSGLAEAMASGADEALAYDSLTEQGSPSDWPAVLSLMMRLKSIAAVITMALGALLFDAAAVNKILSFCGFSLQLEQTTTMRFPVILTLILGLLSCYTVLRMTETGDAKLQEERDSHIVKIKKAMLLTLTAGKWIAATPFALIIILFGTAFDHVLRMLITMTSQFLRLVHLPEASFGLVGAAISLVGLFIPKIAEKMVGRFTPLTNVLFLTCYTIITLVALTFYIPYFGLVPVAMISAGLMFTGFFTSHYLNRITESHQRATVLSFKGLTFNLAYGAIGIGFAVLMNELRHIKQTSPQAVNETLLENRTFMEATFWFVPYAIVILLLVFGYAAWCRIDKNQKTP